MISQLKIHRQQKSVGVLSGVSLVLAMMLSACGGGGSAGTTTEFSNSNLQAASATGLRALPSAFGERKAVNYSPYRTATTEAGRSSEVITDAQVLQDLRLLEQAGIGMIRLFDSNEKVGERTLRVIRANNLDMKVMLGIWISSYEKETNPVTRASIIVANDDEIYRGINLANTYRNEVVAVSVGNETMVSWSGHPNSTGSMAAYIKRVRDAITQPVTSDDNYAFYAGKNPRNASDQAAEVLAQVDFVSIHTYPSLDIEFSNFADNDLLPDWDWQQSSVSASSRAAAMMDAALDKAKKDYSLARSYMDSIGRSNLPIVIGETGWQVGITNKWFKRYINGAANQKMYYARLTDWALASRNGGGPRAIFYFEAFDEPWKQDDDKWGLFDVTRKARCTAQMLNPTGTWTNDTSESCADTAAKYYEPPVVNTAFAGNTFNLFNEQVTGWPTGMRADAFASGTFTVTYPATGDSAPSDQASTLGSSNYISLSSFNNSAGYGWGYLWQSSANPVVSENLSNFSAGTVRFSVKTAYVGKLRVGLSSYTALGEGVDAFVYLANGDYGYCNTGAWCDVSIPLSAFQAANPKLDLRFVLTRFSVADIWDQTGNTARTGQPEIRLDNIYWSR